MIVSYGIIANAMDMNLSKFWEILVQSEACLILSMTSQAIRYDLARKQ